MTYLAIGGAIFCAYVVWALACELAADWIFRRIDRKVGR